MLTTCLTLYLPRRPRQFQLSSSAGIGTKPSKRVLVGEKHHVPRVGKKGIRYENTFCQSDF